MLLRIMNNYYSFIKDVSVCCICNNLLHEHSYNGSITKSCFNCKINIEYCAIGLCIIQIFYNDHDNNEFKLVIKAFIYSDIFIYDNYGREVVSWTESDFIKTFNQYDIDILEQML